MLRNDIFEQFLDTFCYNNYDSWLLTGGNLTLAVFGRWPIYFLKWADIAVGAHGVILRVCEGRWRQESERGTNRGQVGVIAHSHWSSLTRGATGHDYKAPGDPSTPRLTLAAGSLRSHRTLPLFSSFISSLNSTLSWLFFYLPPSSFKSSLCFIYSRSSLSVSIMCFCQTDK